VSRSRDETYERPLQVVQVLCSDAFYGIERYVTTLANGLAQIGCGVAVVGGPGRRMPRELTASVRTWQPARGVLEAFARLRRIGSVDVVHAHMTHAELAAALARPFTRGRLVVTRHFPARRGSTPVGQIAALPIRRAVDLQLACSAYVAARIDGPCSIVYPGVPAPTHHSGRTRERIVLVLQRLEPEKDTTTALRAWASSGLDTRGWTLDIVGDGTERAQLERLAAELAIDGSCRFLGVRDEVGQNLERASILLATARAEPFGLSVVEAMAFGLPVVATAAGGHLENVGASTGAMLFAPGDVDAGARLLRDLAADGELRAAYGSALQELHRERFGADRQVEETLAHYYELVRSRRLPAG
jgi:glycosyltransferase involved in cell wall biosynthesis